MASSSSSPSAPTLSSQSWNYDVFLSFRGEDTRKNFVDHLYAALDRQGIHTYKDDVRLLRGESISPALLKAIEESQIAVIIFSPNYANSTWCLDELTHIMKCRAQRRQIVMPIFYDLEPSEVRKQKGQFLEAFDKHEMENKAEIENWRKALVEASNISGWETKQIANGHEAQAIKEIVDGISQRLNLVTSSGGNENLIGIMTRVQALKSELYLESGGVRMIGIWGLGGGGKTTLASSLYDEISSMYDGRCFVKNIREESSKNGLEKLQEKILSRILKQKQVQEVSRVEEGRRKIKASLGRKKVLIVLDDVDQLDQLKELVGSHDWFGEGSRIIITTRDAHLLNAHRVDVTHPISLLNKHEAIALFCKHAHCDNKPIKDFDKLAEEVVSYAGGLPLALTILGSFLCDKNISQWRSALARLKEIPDEDILGKLKISFDGLKPIEKELFLDIACFFRSMYMQKAVKLLDACGFHPVIGIEVLRQKALIVILDDETFDMHDLVQEMAHYIVRDKYPRNPEKHSRVWKREDIRRILAMDVTTKLDNIEAVDLHGVSYEESQSFLQVAANMCKLRWIDLYCNLPNNGQRDEIILPLPTNFPPKELCCLIISRSISQKQLWEGYKYLPNLARMELYDLPNLITIPDFAGLQNLETFKLSYCSCLEEIHPSIGCLEKLVFLSVDWCPRLRMFPSITRIKKLDTLELTSCYELGIISEIQQNIDSLPHYNMNHRRIQFLHSALRDLDLSRCCLGDEEISSGVLELPNLEELNLSGNPFSRLDFSIMRLPRLKWLKVSYCRGLAELSELPSSISVVLADRCCSFESFGDISKCKWLWKVSIRGENKLDRLCADTLIHSMLQGNAGEDHLISVALQDQFPLRFVDRLVWGKTFRLHLPHDWYDEFCGFLICIVTNASRPRINIIMKQEDPPFDLSQESDESMELIYHGKMTCVGYVSFSSLSDTTLLTSPYNIISFTIQDMGTLYFDGESTYAGIELIPRKCKSEKVQTTDYSEFWDDNFEDEELNTFTIQQCDSESSIEILWRPYSR